VLLIGFGAFLTSPVSKHLYNSRLLAWFDTWVFDFSINVARPWSICLIVLSENSLLAGTNPCFMAVRTTDKVFVVVMPWLEIPMVGLEIRCFKMIKRILALPRLRNVFGF
jgi:hypothetical protein